MNQRELNRTIAAATGETVNRIARLGFLLTDPSEPIADPHDEDLGPLMIDWDADDERSVDPPPPTSLDLLFA